MNSSLACWALLFALLLEQPADADLRRSFSHCSDKSPRHAGRTLQVPLSAEVPISQWKATCLELDESALVEFYHRWADSSADGPPIILEAGYFMMVMSLAQCGLGVDGAIGEIGASWNAKHQGFSFEALAAVRRPNEKLFFTGPFDGDDGFTPANDFGQESWLGAIPREFQRLPGQPLGLTDSDLMRYSGGAGYRILRLDRTVGANETLQLLRVASCVLAEGGVLLVEGLAAVSSRPGLQEGFHRFMLEESSSGQSAGNSRLVPFLWGGKRGGLFLCAERWASSYRQSVWDSLHHRYIFNAVHDTKFLYGSKVLYTALWEAEASNFEALLGSWKPRTVRMPVSDEMSD